MTIYQKILDELKEARKNNSELKGELMLLASDIRNRQIASDGQDKDDISIEAIQKAIKKIDEEAELAPSDKLKNAKKLLQSFIPEGHFIAGKDLLKLVMDTIEGHPEAKQGQIIGLVMKENKGRVDARELSQLVRGFF